MPAATPSIATPILLLGADGMLGRAWCQLLTARQLAYIAPTLDQVNFNDLSSVEALAKGDCKTVINCAGYTDVDGAETNEAMALQINAIGPGALARACASLDATLVHYSTDYVFDGKASSPYTTDHPRNPIGAYARSKWQGEEAIAASECRHLTIRTSWLYAPWGKNFVRTIRALVLSKPEIRVVNDQRGRPTSAEYLARTSLTMLAREISGIAHVTDDGECSWFEFATEIARLTPGAGKVLPCSTVEFPRPAPRPAYSVLDLEKTQHALGPLPHWKTNLADVLSRMEA